MAHPDQTPRDKSHLTPLDGGVPSVVEARLTALENRHTSPLLAECEEAVRVLAVLKSAIADKATELEWFIKVGTRARELLADLSPPDEGPELGEQLIAAMNPVMPSKGQAGAQAAPAGGLPPELAKMLAAAGIKL